MRFYERSCAAVGSVVEIKAGQYRAPPVKRAYIPKAGGKEFSNVR